MMSQAWSRQVLRNLGVCMAGIFTVVCSGFGVSELDQAQYAI